jgi:hypothetical protein
MYIKPSLGIALRVEANAGVIASSKGKANVMPRPRRNERRGSAFFDINIV